LPNGAEGDGVHRMDGPNKNKGSLPESEIFQTDALAWQTGSLLEHASGAQLARDKRVTERGLTSQARATSRRKPEGQAGCRGVGKKITLGRQLPELCHT